MSIDLQEPVDIVLSVRNGEPYVQEFLASLDRQTYAHWRLVVRDNVSQDRTIDIIQEHFAARPEKLRLVTDHLGNIGPKMGFSRALSFATARYVMFADHDDVWLPRKIEASVTCIRQVEHELGADVPILCHGDLLVVDDGLNLLNSSFWRYQHLPNDHDYFHRLLIQNTVTGCATIVNRSLLDKALPIPDKAVMHDYWLVLTAAAFGTVTRVPGAPLIMYRQHKKNDTGAKRWSVSYAYKMLLGAPSMQRTMQGSLSVKFGQAAVFLMRFGAGCPPHVHRVVSGFATLPQLGWMKRRLFLIEHGIFMSGLLRNIGLLLFV